MTVYIAALLTCLIATSACVGQHTYEGPFVVGATPKDALPEVSGIVQSRESFVLWMINDSGDEPYVYAVDTRKGLLSKHRLAGAANIDWEDIAIAPSNAGNDSLGNRLNDLYIADFGDNNAKRKSVVIYRIPEPEVFASSTISESSVKKFELTYPDGPRDAEALLVDPLRGEIVIVTKRDAKSRVYSCDDLTSSPGQLTFRGELPYTLITAGDVASHGRTIILKNYHKAWEWTRDPKEPLWKALLREGKRIPYGPELQGEAICYDQDNRGYYTTSEREDGGEAAPIFYYPLQASTTPLNGRDMKQPQIEVSAVSGRTGFYRLRYAIAEVERVEIKLYNEGMFKMMTIAEDTAESGAQEREIDMRKFPSGSYAILLTTPHSHASCLLEHVFR